MRSVNPSGNMAWSKTTRTLLVSNLQDGIDVYRIGLGERPHWALKLKTTIQNNIPIQVTFGVDDKFAISGSDNGEVRLWKMEAHTSVTAVLRHSNGTSLATSHEVVMQLPFRFDSNTSGGGSTFFWFAEVFQIYSTVLYAAT